jgi:hypothetical protein
MVIAYLIFVLTVLIFISAGTRSRRHGIAGTGKTRGTENYREMKTLYLPLFWSDCSMAGRRSFCSSIRNIRMSRTEGAIQEKDCVKSTTAMTQVTALTVSLPK